MKNILFATAHSEYAENIWKYVLKLAQHFDATITLMHVFEEPSPVFAGGIMEEFYNGNIDKFKADQHKREEERLRMMVQKMPKQYHSIKVKGLVKIEIGGIAGTILTEEKKGKYDLLVLGTATKKSLVNRILGSVTKTVVNESNTPVFLVPPSNQFLGINKMVYATNFKYDDIDRIQRLLEWVKVFGAKLHLLHIYEEKGQMMQAANKMDSIVKVFKKEQAEGVLMHQLINGNVTQSIRYYLKTNKVRMIALNTHKRGLLAQLFQASETDEILLESVIPVLVFK